MTSNDVPRSAIARLMALPAKWRGEADRGQLLQGLKCADDLDAALRACADALAPSPEKGQDDASRVEGFPAVGHGDLPRKDHNEAISPPAPTLAERIVQWREQSQRSQRDADMARRVDDGAEGMYCDGRAVAFERCADEAELILQAQRKIDYSNHHNALLCPYCNPDNLVLRAAALDTTEDTRGGTQ